MAVIYRVRCLLRAQWRSTAALTLIVAAVTGAVLALAAGAARTASAPDRYTAARGGGFDGTVQQGGGPPRTAEVAALPGVTGVEAITFVFGGMRLPDGGDVADGLTFAGSYRALGVDVVAGRVPDPDRTDEFVATRSYVDAGGLALGTQVELATLSQEQADRAGYDAFETEGPHGPSAKVTLVGVVDGPSKLDDPTPLAVVSPSVIDRGAGVAITFMAVDLRPGIPLKALRAGLDTLPDGAALSLEPAQLVSSAVRTAVDGQARGFWLLASVAGLASVVVLGQLLTRSVRLSAQEGPPLEALGFNRLQLLVESAARAAIPIAAGACLGVVVAGGLSATFPTGFVRRLEPHPGLRFDAGLLLIGAALVITALVVWTVAALVVGRTRHGADRPSEVVEWVAARCPNAALATGFRFAFTRARRDRGSVRATVAGVLATVVLLAGTVVFGSSLARLVVDRDRFGSNYDLFVGTGEDVIPDEVIHTLEADPDVAAVLVYGTGHARVGSATIGLAGMAPVKGDVAPTTLSGRLPAADDEIALGRLTAKRLGVRIGTELALETEAGPRRFRVTGLAVIPPVEELAGVGQDAVVTMGGLRRAEPEATASSAAVGLRPGAPKGTAERLGFGEDGSRPAVIVNLARIRAIPFLLAGLLGALAVLTVVHVMITSVHHRRRDVALLRSLGADGRWVKRAVHWQATSFSLVPLTLGVPLGLIAGRLVFGAFADSVGTVRSASFPYALLAAVMGAFIVLANAVAAVPAARARRLAPAPLLTTE